MAQGKRYRVKQGDCISSIADENGLFWESIWQHAENSGLRDLRGDPNVLVAGDKVFIPDKVTKEESCAVDQSHKFTKLGVPAKLNLQILDNHQVQANEPFELMVDGVTYTGTTDGDGRLEQSIGPSAQNARLTLTNSGRIYELELGGMDPVTESEGVKARLENLGFDTSGDEEKLIQAIKRFQLNQNLKVTGEVDDATQAKLVEVHGS
jgi:N-acetylmuramoyl-L-alanine amidase